MHPSLLSTHLYLSLSLLISYPHHFFFLHLFLIPVPRSKEEAKYFFLLQSLFFGTRRGEKKGKHDAVVFFFISGHVGKNETLDGIIRHHIFFYHLFDCEKKFASYGDGVLNFPIMIIRLQCIMHARFSKTKKRNNFGDLFAKPSATRRGRADRPREDKQPRLPSIPATGGIITPCCLFWQFGPLLCSSSPGSLLPSGQSYSQPLPFSPLFRKAKVSHANATPRAKSPLSPQRRLFLFGIAWPPNPSPVAAIARQLASSVVGSERGLSVSGGSRRRRAGGGVITPLVERRSPLPRFCRLRRLT